MNIKTFYIVAKQILELIEKGDQSTHYSNLVSHLTNIRTNPTEDLQTSVNQTIEKIKANNAMVEESLAQIPHSKYVVEKLGLSEIIGEGASQRLDKIIEKEIYVAPDKVQQLINNINETKKTLASITDGFDELGVKYSLDKDIYLLSIDYYQSSAVQTTEQLKTQLDKIEGIVHAFARLTDDPKAFEKPIIASISKSSPLQIDIGDGITIAATLSIIARAVTWAMDRVEQSYDIRIKKQELKKQKLTNKQIEEGFKELEESKVSKEAVKEFAIELCKQANPKDASGAKSEIEKAVADAVMEIVELIDSQAEIRIYLPPEKTKTEGDEAEPVAVAVFGGLAYKKLEAKQEKLRLIAASQQKSAAQDGKEKTSKSTKSKKADNK